MADNQVDVVLLTGDARLRQVVSRQRPPEARLLCLGPDELGKGSPPRAEQWWIDLDAGSVPEKLACRRRVYFYSRPPLSPNHLPPGVFLRKPCAGPIAAILWAGVTTAEASDAALTSDRCAPNPRASAGSRGAPAGERPATAEFLPGWLLELHQLDLRELCRKCVETLPDRTGYAEIALYLHDGEHNLLTLAGTNCRHPIDLAIRLDPDNTDVIAAVARDRRLLITADLARAAESTGARCPADIARRQNRAAVLAPLVCDGRLYGLLRLSRRQQTRLSEVGLPFEPIFAFIARCLRHARLYRRARVEARVDRLTGLFNYRWMTEALGKEIRRAQRYGTPLALSVIDVDGLKSVNDRFGHAAGDALLRHVAGKITAALRQTDSAARVGGDEFVVLLPATDIAGARQVAERILSAIRTDAPVVNNSQLPVAASLGVAEWVEGWDVKRLFRAADRAMYAAKRKGPNCLAWCPRPAKPAAKRTRHASERTASSK